MTCCQFVANPSGLDVGDHSKPNTAVSQEYFRWPGDLSPSLGLKFTDVPTGTDGVMGWGAEWAVGLWAG